MKFVYREVDFREAIFEQIFSDVPEEVTKFELEHIVFGQIIKIDGEKLNKNCVIEADENGLLIILMYDFKVDKATGYHHFKFTDMQRIQVKEGSIFNKLILQFFNGRNYVIRVNKRNMEHLPNQHENSKKIINILCDQNLRNIDNNILKKNKKIALWVLIMS